MGHLRTKEGAERYLRHLRERTDSPCPLCTRESIADFMLWQIIENRFPYDLIADVHHMLVPKRHAKKHELTDDERRELEVIQNTYVQNTYEWMLEAMHKKQSVPEHYHLHLIVAKDR